MTDAEAPTLHISGNVSSVGTRSYGRFTHAHCQTVRPLPPNKRVSPDWGKPPNLPAFMVSFRSLFKHSIHTANYPSYSLPAFNPSQALVPLTNSSHLIQRQDCNSCCHPKGQHAQPNLLISTLHPTDQECLTADSETLVVRNTPSTSTAR